MYAFSFEKDVVRAGGNFLGYQYVFESQLRAKLYRLFANTNSEYDIEEMLRLASVVTDTDPSYHASFCDGYTVVNFMNEVSAQAFIERLNAFISVKAARTIELLTELRASKTALQEPFVSNLIADIQYGGLY